MSVMNRKGGGPDGVGLPAGAETSGGPSRRSVLRGAAGTGVAGLAAGTLIGLPAGQALAAPRPAARSASAAGHSAGKSAGETAEDVVVHLRDAGSGELEIFSGTSMIRLHDPDLASRLVRAIR
jgi:hypothetical protein